MRSRLRLRDAFALGAVGLRARRVRSALSALGIAVAIAALVAVLGIAASAKADLLAQLGAEGNLLTLAAGQTFTGNPTPLPATAEQMIKAVPPVREVTAVSVVHQATVRRSAAIPVIQTGGISVLAAEPSLLETLSATMLRGHSSIRLRSDIQRSSWVTALPRTSASGHSPRPLRSTSVGPTSSSSEF